MPALVIASRVYPTCGKYQVRKSGKPDFRCIHDFQRLSSKRRGWPAQGRPWQRKRGACRRV